MTDIRSRVGLRVKELRARTGLSQESLARSIGMSRTYLAEVEVGRRNISIVNLERISGGLGVSLAELFETFTVDQTSL